MNLFRDLGERTERLKRRIERRRTTYECEACGERYHGEYEQCPACGAEGRTEVE